MFPLQLSVRHAVLATDALAAVARQLLNGAEDIAVSLDGPEVCLKGVEDLPIEELLTALRERTGDGLSVGRFKIEYLEAPTLQLEWEGREISNSAATYAHVWLRLRPRPRGAGTHISSQVPSDVLPSEFVSAAERGVRDALAAGPLAGYPVTDLEVSVIDGSFHATDSTAAAFAKAAKDSCVIALQRTNPVLLEPIVAVTIHAPSEYIPAIVFEMRARRGRVSRLSEIEDVTMLEALVPLAETLGYRTDLKRLGRGQVTYSVRFSHYSEAPGAGSGDDPAAMAARVA